MGYAVELNFDAESSARIRNLWQCLADAGVNRTMIDVNASPHISLAVFSEIEPEILRPLLAEFAAMVTPIPVRLAAVGTFPIMAQGDEGAVFLAPSVSTRLLAEHDRFHRMLNEYNIYAHEYYRPGNWVPHCTVALNAAPDQVMKAVAICRHSDVFQSGELVDASLVEFRPVKEYFRFPFAVMTSENQHADLP